MAVTAATPSISIAEAQKDVRRAFFGGFMGQLVSSLLWLVSAALATWSTPRLAITWLVVAGFFILPLTQAGLRMVGRTGRLRRDNPLGGLAMQVAFTLPLVLPVVGAAALYRLNWFYPAFMIVLGAHYLPFVFLYGMPMFYGLAGVLMAAGLLLALYLPGSFSTGAWLTGAILAIFAWVGRRQAIEAERKESEERVG